MKAMVLDKLAKMSEVDEPLSLVDLPRPEPDEGEILIRVLVCGVCHTELDEIEGRTAPPSLPVVPGHQVVGYVEANGSGVSRFAVGDRVGVGWIYSACGHCHYCRNNQENLCADFRATGRDADGGYAEYMTVPERFAYPIPDVFSDAEAAPLLCAGAVGYRSLRLARLRDGLPLGLTGFGASGHLVLPTVRHAYPNSDVYVFARNPDEREFAAELGAVWTGKTEARAPVGLAAIIDTTPAWKPVVEGLKNLAPGGRMVINAIRKGAGDQDELLRISYADDLWMEREIKSVANVTRADIEEFLSLAAEIPLKPTVQEFDLADANRALKELSESKIRGAKVLRISS